MVKQPKAAKKTTRKPKKTPSKQEWKEWKKHFEAGIDDILEMNERQLANFIAIFDRVLTYAKIRYHQLTVTRKVAEKR